ncbi:hypothetical protein AX17_003374 [Amanita inopinata Kibby_2008]|nr:hypothetical protein AX17_003374 [Amanita inopinata Kibby_2008]
MSSYYLVHLDCIRQELTDDNEPSSVHMTSICGHDNLAIVRDAIDVIATHKPSRLVHEKLNTLIDSAHKLMSSTSHMASFQWRRLHTDSCIVRAVLLLEAAMPLDAISSLDHAIIISGAAGNDRLHVIQTLMQAIQSRFSITSQFAAEQHISNKQIEAVDQLQTANLCITCLVHPPSLLAFQTTYFREPFLIRGYAKDWPALQEHRWCSPQYLRSVSGPGRIVPVEVGKDYRSNEWSQKLISWDQFLSSLDFVDEPRQKDTDMMYLAQHNLFMQFPMLGADIIIPDYVYAALNAADHIPPQNEEQLIVNAWLGPRGTTSPAHTVRGH